MSTGLQTVIFHTPHNKNATFDLEHGALGPRLFHTPLHQNASYDLEYGAPDRDFFIPPINQNATLRQAQTIQEEGTLLQRWGVSVSDV